MTEQEMIDRAQSNALAAIAEVKARQTAESRWLQATCEQAIIGKLTRSVVTGVTKSGRIISETRGAATAGEQALTAWRQAQ